MKDWRRYAACREIPTEMFYCEDQGDSWLSKHYQDLLKICRNDCPVQRQCLATALRLEEGDATVGRRYGIWGGMTPPERDLLWGRLQAQRDDYVLQQCKQGHDLTPDNVRASASGVLTCLQCEKDKRHRVYLEKLEKKKKAKAGEVA